MPLDYIVIPNILKMKSNVDFIPHFSLGPNLYEDSENDSSMEYPIQIGFNLAGHLVRPPKIDKTMFPFSVGEDVVFYEHPISKIFRVQAAISNVLKTPQVFANREFYYLIRNSVGNLTRVGELCTNVVWAKLAMNQMNLIHSSCVTHFNDGVIISGPSGTGKTLLAYTALKHGFRMVSEDITVIDQEKAYSCPFTQSYLNEAHFIDELYKNRRIDTLTYLKLRFAKRGFALPFFSESTFRPRNVTLIDDFQLNTKIKAICLLELKGGGSSFRSLDKEETIRRMLLLNRLEFRYFQNTFLAIYSLHNADFQYQRLICQSDDVITKLVEKAECFLLRSRSPLEYTNLLLKMFSK